MARISSSMKYLKLGDFEVEFQDTIACDPSGSLLGIQLYNFVVSNAIGTVLAVFVVSTEPANKWCTVMH